MNKIFSNKVKLLMISLIEFWHFVFVWFDSKNVELKLSSSLSSHRRPHNPRSLHKALYSFVLLLILYNFKSFIEDITRWREDMNFMFEWQEQYLTSERTMKLLTLGAGQLWVHMFP